MGVTTRFPDGVTNVNKISPFNGLSIPFPGVIQHYFNDFNAYSSSDWLETVVDTDADSANARSIDATAGGVLNILLDNNAADSTNLALGGAGAEQFLLSLSKKAWLAAKFSSTDVDKNYLAIALAPISDVDLQGGLPNDHIAIKVDAADANIDISISKDGTASTSNAVGTLSNYAEGTNNLTEVVVYYNGRGIAEIYVDSVKKAELNVASTLPDDEELTLQMEVHNSDAAADAMAVDWVFVGVER